MKAKKTILLSILAIALVLIPTVYAEKVRREETQRISLIQAFRNMFKQVKNAISPDKAQQAYGAAISSSYKITSRSIITSHRLNDVFDGVIKGKGQKFIDEARKNDICPIFLAAIAIHESANGNSLFARNKNNIFGIYLNKKYHTFDTVDDCIEYSAKLLGGRLYAKSKNPTIQGVQKVYCPVGAANDPKSLNKYWLNGVIDKMVKIQGKVVYYTK